MSNTNEGSYSLLNPLTVLNKRLKDKEGGGAARSGRYIPFTVSQAPTYTETEVIKENKKGLNDYKKETDKHGLKLIDRLAEWLVYLRATAPQHKRKTLSFQVQFRSMWPEW